MKITANELRQRYISFFVSKGHVQIPSASLVPENDPSVLFTTAGMHPLVPYLLGELHPSGTRLVDVQKCVRTGDIDEVGDSTHLTFFEMLGNWSLGDYFKQDAIKWSFEFLTDELGISLDRLAVSVFAGDNDAPFDQESYDRWVELGIDPMRVAKLGKDDNWWPAGGKNPGPQGPDTEMFYWTGGDDAPTTFDPSDKRWVEIWNDVFMQFNRTPDGRFEPLGQQNVDTGMGLERTLAVLNGRQSVYETELFIPIINAIEKRLQGKRYGEDPNDDRLIRIVADHIRSAVMIIHDGVEPGKDDRAYIPRKLLRRAVLAMLELGAISVVFDGTVRAINTTLIDVYTGLENDLDRVMSIVKKETKDYWLSLMTSAEAIKPLFRKFLAERDIDTRGIQHVPSGSEFPHMGFIDTKVAYELGVFAHDRIAASEGVPLEFFRSFMRNEHYHFSDGAEVKFEEGFKIAEERHRALSRAGAGQKFAGGLADHSEESKKLHTATHLLHKALRMVLGDHVAQKGSNITAERLRFDFSHGKKMTAEEVKKVEEIVNEQIKVALPMGFKMMTVEEAKQAGAIGLFEDKYAHVGDKVKVYTAGDTSKGIFSREICGGPHVENTSMLGAFAIQKEEASSSGVRRIKAVIGTAAEAILASRP